jgi:hypothetical protein
MRCSCKAQQQSAEISSRRLYLHRRFSHENSHEDLDKAPYSPRSFANTDLLKSSFRAATRFDLSPSLSAPTTLVEAERGSSVAGLELDVLPCDEDRVGGRGGSEACEVVRWEVKAADPSWKKVVGSPGYPNLRLST